MYKTPIRKLSAIVLLFVFLMYHLGYYGIYLSSRYQLEKNWEEKIEKEELSSKELLQTSLPISFPYRPDQPHFQSASGTVEIDGKFYRVVKQRYAKDTLHIMYVEDIALKDLHQSLQEWIVSITHKPASEKGNYQFWKSMGKDFLLSMVEKINPWVLQDHQIQYGYKPLIFHQVFLTIPSPPPKG